MQLSAGAMIAIFVLGMVVAGLVWFLYRNDISQETKETIDETVNKLEEQNEKIDTNTSNTDDFLANRKKFVKRRKL